MLNVFMKKSAEEMHIQLSDGRIIPLEDLVWDYERLLDEEALRKKTTSPQVGEWFRIDRDVIDKSKEEIRCKCNESEKGKKLWKRFEKSNKIADENPDQYPRLIETYIFEHAWGYLPEWRMREMCEERGDGMCDEVICDLELQMRICNGLSVDDIVQKPDELPRERVLKLRNGETGYFGGGTDDGLDTITPAELSGDCYQPNNIKVGGTPYAFRRVLSEH